MSLTFYTPYGQIKIQLCYINEMQSKHAENFLRHCASGTYNQNRILRFIKDFIVQSGDKTNTGKVSENFWESNSVQGLADKYFMTEGRVSQLEFKRGSVAMIKQSKDPNGLGSQFFVVLSDTYDDALRGDDNNIYIGTIIDGFDALTKLEEDEELNDESKLKKSGKPTGKWKNKIWIEKVEIHYNPYA